MFIYYKSDNYINYLCIYILQRNVSEGNFSSCMRKSHTAKHAMNTILYTNYKFKLPLLPFLEELIIVKYLPMLL